MVSTFVIILRELGGGHGEMNAPCSSEELQIGPGEDLKNHVLVFEIQSLMMVEKSTKRYFGSKEKGTLMLPTAVSCGYSAEWHQLVPQPVHQC